MQKINKPTDYDIVWAEFGSKSETIRDKIPTGWEVEIPAREDMNALQNRQDSAIAYILQVGVSEFDTSSVYYTGSVVNLGGVLYKSITQSQGINPASSPNKDLYWEKLSASYPEFLAIKNRIESADPFNQYLLKAAPETTAKYAGSGFVSYQNSGQGWFFNGGAIEYRYNSNVIGKVPQTVLTSEDNSKNFATTEWVKSLIAEKISMLEVKVGESIITNSSVNPALSKGYGTWVLDCQGQTIVGVSEITDSPSWTKVVDNTFGEYSVALTIPQLPSHNHYTDQRFNKLVSIAQDIYGDPNIRQTTADGFDYITMDQEIGAGNISEQAKLLMQIKDVGGNQAHNNVQPSKTKYIWTRIS